MSLGKRYPIFWRNTSPSCTMVQCSRFLNPRSQRQHPFSEHLESPNNAPSHCIRLESSNCNFFRWQEMSGHLLDLCHMDVAFRMCRQWLQAQVLVMPAKFTISRYQTCIPALPGILLVTGTVSVCMGYVSLV